MNQNYKVKDKKEAGRELTIDVVVEKSFVEKFRDKALKRIGKDLEIKGFRKGMAPDKMIIETVGEIKVFEEQSYQALYELLPIIVTEEKIDALTTPKITITKISPSDNLEFKAVFTLMPMVELADYKKIAKSVAKSDKVSVTEKEINDYIDQIRKSRAEGEFMRKKTGGEKVEESDKEKLPELNDEFVKSLGNFKDVADFKKQLTENMQTEKEMKEKNKRRTEIIEKIIADSKIDIPEVLIDEEKERMLNQYKNDIERIGISFEEYLKEIKKTVDDLKKEWYTDAVKRAKMNFILPKIANLEKISADKDRLEHEMKHIVEHHKDVDPVHARAYLSHVLTNEKVFEFLENI